MNPPRGSVSSDIGCDPPRAHCTHGRARAPSLLHPSPLAQVHCRPLIPPDHPGRSGGRASGRPPVQGIDAARAATAHYDDPDVVIIGAGASGAAVAWSLASAGFKVVTLEQGDWVNPQTLPHHQADWEIRRLTDFNADPNVRGLAEDYPVNEQDSTFSPLMFNAVGGSTIHWSAHFPRYHPSDFRVRSLDGVGDDWPLTYDELEPFYDLNDRTIGVAGLRGDPSQPPRSPRQTRPIPLGPLGEAMATGFERLGWHWWPSDTAIITEPFGDRPACNNCGPCDVGCPT